MKRPGRSSPVLLSAAALATLAVYADAGSSAENAARAGYGSAADVPLKDAKLNIEHNATDKDTGFQGFIDSEGWRRLVMRGPAGEVLAFEGRGSLGELGLTELFFETVEPENAKVPIDEMLAKLPEGNYTIAGPGQENGTSRADVRNGMADARHPGGPEARLPTRGRTGAGARHRRSLESRVQDDHRQARDDHRVPAHHREGRRASPPHDREVRAEHVPASVGDKHQGAGRISPAPHRVQLGGAGDRAQREPNALVRLIPDALVASRRGSCHLRLARQAAVVRHASGGSASETRPGGMGGARLERATSCL